MARPHLDSHPPLGIQRNQKIVKYIKLNIKRNIRKQRKGDKIMAIATSKAGYGSGWHKESLRHSNARRLGHAGGRYAELVGKKPYSEMSYSQLKKKGIDLPPQKDTDGDGIKNKNDCRPLNSKEQGAVHQIDKALDKAEDKVSDPSKKQKILKAREELHQATTKEKLKMWVKKHKNALAGVGVAGGSLLGGALALAVGIPFLVGLGITSAFIIPYGVAGRYAYKRLKEKE
jgi:hypothetical protein